MLLPDQDRTRWDRALIAEGQAIVRGLPAPQPARAVPDPGGDRRRAQRTPPAAADTDWAQILALYDQLTAVAPTPVVALNRAVAVAEVHGPAAGLAVVDRLDLPAYHLFHATRADLLVRLGRTDEAAAAYERAMELASNAAERAFLAGRLSSVR